MHAIMFVTFLGLAATGLTIRFSTNAWAQHFALAIGGFGTILFLHKLCAVILSLEFLYHLQNIAVRILVRKEKGLLWGPDSMVPNLKDLKDIIGNFRWFFGRGPRPKLERYAYWEKFDYWSVFWGMIIIGLSGYVMWFGPFFGKFLPGWALNAVQIVHGEEALLAATFIFSHPLHQRASTPRQLSHGYHHLHRHPDRGGVQGKASRRIRSPRRRRQARAEGHDQTPYMAYEL